MIDIVGVLKEPVGLISTLITIGGTVWGWWKFVYSKSKARKQLATQLAVGDRIVASADLEGEGYDQALQHFEKALAVDPGNLAIMRRILRATRRRNETAMPVALMDGPPRQEIDAVLERLYELDVKEDKELLLEEAQLLELIGKRESAIAALRKAQALAPDDPEMLSLLGACTKDAELVRRAIAAQPENAAHHHALAYVLSARGEYGAAVREYRSAAGLAGGRDFASRRTRSAAMSDLLQLFKQHGDKLDLPPEERIAALEAVVASKVSLDRTQHVMLAELYLAAGSLQKAHDAIRAAMGTDQQSWRSYVPQLRLYKTILERGGFDAAALARVNATLEQVAERQHYDELLEIGEGPQHRKIGLRIDKTAGGGLLVARCFAGYPFAKAGVRDGDRILEFAHRKTENLRDIWTRLIQFAPGSDVPLRVQRAGETLDLTLVVQ